jgi:hypothetical protein
MTSVGDLGKKCVEYVQSLEPTPDEASAFRKLDTESLAAVCLSLVSYPGCSHALTLTAGPFVAHPTRKLPSLIHALP